MQIVREKDRHMMRNHIAKFCSVNRACGCDLNHPGLGVAVPANCSPEGLFGQPDHQVKNGHTEWCKSRLVELSLMGLF